MSTVTVEVPRATPRSQFESETTEHVMTVKKDDGLYRHLRFAKPGTGMWSWEIVTWPGHLAIAGDIGDGWSFSRLEDMFQFFNPGREPHRINDSYWWEKMPSQLRTAAKKFSADSLKACAQSEIAEWDLLPADKARAQGQLNDAWRAVDYELEHEYRAVLDDFRFIPESTTSNISGQPMRFYDTWEYEAKEYDWHFLLALYAIVHSVETYKAWKADQLPEVTDTLLIDQGWTRPADVAAREPLGEIDCD